MATLAAKLQLGPGQAIEIVHRPDGVELDVPPAEPGEADAVLAFVGDSSELDDVWSALRLRPA